MAGGWWMTAKPGDKIVCTTAEPGLFKRLGPDAYEDGLDGLEPGHVYTVKAIGPNFIEEHRLAGDIQVVVEEIDRGFWYGREVGYDVRRFRPIQTKSTDTGMAILKRFLERPEQRIEEDA